MDRCPWPGNNELMIKYHDEEWGVPLHDDRELFEFPVLEGVQAGLSWQIVLKSRASRILALGIFAKVLYT